MITSPTTNRQPPQPPASTPASSPVPTVAELQTALGEMALALQISRASTLSLMRMQLAVRKGERMQAMEAMDRLDTLDAELARVVHRLPSSDADADPQWQTLAKYLDEQKLALAFEKLALASGVVGPDLVSIENAWTDSEDGAPDPDTAPEDQPGPMPDLSPLPPAAEQADAEAEPRGPLLSSRALGLIVTVVLACGVAAAVWMSMQP